MSTAEKIEDETVTIIKAEPLSMVPVDHRVGNELLETDIARRKKNLAILLKIIHPSQLMNYGDGDKKSLYLTAGGADVALRAMGFRWGHKTVAISKDDDGVTAIAEADLLTPDGAYYEHFIGIRRMVRDDGGFKGYIKNEPDLMRAALANMTHAAGQQLLGLRMLSPSDCKDVGIDLDKLERHVDFQDHTAKDDRTAPRIKFGKNKDQTITEINDNDLAWHIAAATKDVASTDPAKAKWRAKNQKWLDQLGVEQARRANAITVEEAKAGAFDYGPPPMGEREPGTEG